MENESLLGLKTITRRLITLEGISPVGLGQWLREYDDDDLYGIAEPRTGASFFWEFSHLDSLGFGKFIKLFFLSSIQKALTLFNLNVLLPIKLKVWRFLTT
ncbi:MAG: hypothetical protein BRC38_13090 [Cyanobacteria bacterium QH_6_48_35]|nr:MAG: hypothetical protein BRC38_13090 [Cyanobacteria bacterium QH_6_48_35]